MTVTTPAATIAATPGIQDIHQIQKLITQSIMQGEEAGALVTKAEMRAWMKRRDELKAVKGLAAKEAKAARKAERARRKIVAALTQADPA
jgi:flagellar biosynthesis chaperone FliJ